MVLIKGLQKISLIDFEPYSVATIFVGGCNFRCGFCHNPGLVLHSKDIKTIKEEEVLSFLEKRKKWLDGVCITGGEPTLYTDLPSFISQIKEKGFLVKLDTDGYNPTMIKRLIDNKLLDYIAMDIKTSLDDYENVVGVKADINQVKKSIKLIQKSGVDYEFRTTVVPGLITKENILKIGELLKGSKKYILQNFRSKRDMIENRFKNIKPYKQKEIDDMKKSVDGFFKEVIVKN